MVDLLLEGHEAIELLERNTSENSNIPMFLWLRVAFGYIEYYKSMDFTTN